MADTDFDPSEEMNEESSKKVSDSIRKILTAGLGAAFMTEESIRSYVKDVKLPKEVLGYLLQSAAKSKEDMMDKVGNEVVKIISKIDFVSEASKFVEEHKFKITAEVEVIKKEGGGNSLKFDMSSRPEDIIE